MSKRRRVASAKDTNTYRDVQQRVCHIYCIFLMKTARVNQKKRPAIVVDFNEKSTRVIILKVTTQGIRTEYDYPLLNAEMANLKQGSVVRCNHTLTLDNSFKCEKHGSLSSTGCHGSSAIIYKSGL